ncbi:MAG: penicillin-binding transpeptidase domain-containing protein [Planctomycetaceae bacterium]
MRNRPTSFLQESSPVDKPSESLDFDGNPRRRLIFLFALAATAMIPVAVKLFHLQATHAEEFIARQPARVSESFEQIPTTNGRIIVGGTVLARDSATYRIKVHYRWIEEPIDELWLRMKAWSRVNRSDRHRKDRVAAAEQELLVERKQMWQRLTERLDVTPEELGQQRRLVQSRVERIISSVEQRQSQQRQERARKQDLLTAGRARETAFERVFDTVQAELTTPPDRRRIEPVVVTEEQEYHVIAENVPFEHVKELVTRPDLYPGIDFELVTRREYPQGAFASHIIGYRQAFTQKDREASRNRPLLRDTELQAGDFVGRTGIERSYDHQLRGQRGLRRIVRNSDGEIVRRETVQEPRPGSDVILALDETLQREAERLLDRDVMGAEPVAWLPPSSSDSARPSRTVLSQNDNDHETSHPDAIASQNLYPTGACLIAMNVHTGELLAAACAPRFDLRLLVDHNEELWQMLNNDPGQPLFPRLTRMALPPGSVFKTLSSIAALEDADFDPQQVIFCRGYLHVPHKHRCYIFRHYGVGHGEMTLEDAICRSCNVFFFATAEKLGAEPLIRTAQRMGFGQPTGIDLPGEVAGNLPQLSSHAAITLASLQHATDPGGLSVNAETQASFSRSVPVDALGLAIGQSTLTVTPLQVVRLMAAIANGGELVTPQVVRQVRQRHVPASGNPVVRPQSISTGLSARTLHILRGGLEKVVASPRGTAYRRVRLKSVSVAGKTGTAETGGGRPDHAWFAGYVPAERPQIAFVAVVEHGGSGGTTAGPLAKKLIAELLKQRLIVPPVREQ